AIGGPRRARTTAVGGRWVLVPPASSQPLGLPGAPGTARRRTAAERRSRNLTVLAGFIILTFIAGMGLRGLRFLLVIHVVADVVFVAYFLAALYFAARP